MARAQGCNGSVGPRWNGNVASGKPWRRCAILVSGGTANRSWEMETANRSWEFGRPRRNCRRPACVAPRPAQQAAWTSPPSGRRAMAAKGPKRSALRWAICEVGSRAAFRQGARRGGCRRNRDHPRRPRRFAQRPISRARPHGHIQRPAKNIARADHHNRAGQSGNS